VQNIVPPPGFPSRDSLTVLSEGKTILTGGQEGFFQEGTSQDRGSMPDAVRQKAVIHSEVYLPREEPYKQHDERASQQLNKSPMKQVEGQAYLTLETLQLFATSRSDPSSISDDFADPPYSVGLELPPASLPAMSGSDERDSNAREVVAVHGGDSW
jgi:hypothetical protein